jgi:hypothetical protein
MLRNVERTIGRGRLVGAGVLVLLVAAAFYLGTTRPAVSMHTAVPASASGAISIEADGWTYSVPLDGVEWIDGHGSWHDSERPSCLPPGGTTSPVTFASVQVTVEGSTWRPVVLVDCR